MSEKKPCARCGVPTKGTGGYCCHIHGRRLCWACLEWSESQLSDPWDCGAGLSTWIEAAAEDMDRVSRAPTNVR